MNSGGILTTGRPLVTINATEPPPQAIYTVVHTLFNKSLVSRTGDTSYKNPYERTKNCVKI